MIIHYLRKQSTSILLLTFLAFYLLATLLLAGCSTSNIHKAHQANSTLQPSQHTPTQLIQMANTASSPERELYLLQAANGYLDLGDWGHARQLLDQLSQYALTFDQQVFRELLEAKLALYQNQPEKALNILQAIPNNDSINKQLRIEKHELTASAFIYNKQPLNSALERMAITPLLDTTQAQQVNQEAIWESLQQMTATQLQQAQSHYTVSLYQGWFQLAYLAKIYQNQPTQLVHALQKWREKYPNHPANKMLPHSLEVIDTQTPQKIVLLLPLSGKYGPSGQAIRNGFLTAYYQDKAQDHTTLSIDVMDTSEMTTVDTLYQNAVTQQANIVVGPLSKHNVQTLAQLQPLPIPVLALNSIDASQLAKPRSKSFFQFSLSPQAEAKRTAQRAWRDGHTQAIMITPQGPWGEGIAAAFKQQWQAQGGRIAGSISTSSRSALSDEIKHLLEVDSSQARHRQLDSVLHENTKAIPERRQDVDAIFLAEPPAMARQIRPLLKFYYAGNIPVYATSLIYSGSPHPNLDRDLNGIIFGDMPWVLAPTPAQKSMQQKMRRLWPQSFERYTRLYALGYDAYHLTSQINRLELFPQFGIQGATGQLSLSQNHIQRRLTWARFHRGTPVLTHQ